jgi:hypothetical protein
MRPTVSARCLGSESRNSASAVERSSAGDSTIANCAGTATIDFGAAIKGAGGSVDIYDLPEMDIHGNSHVMMMDRNSRQIADLIDGWLAKRKFKR